MSLIHYKNTYPTIGMANLCEYSVQRYCLFIHNCRTYEYIWLTGWVFLFESVLLYTSEIVHTAIECILRRPNLQQNIKINHNWKCINTKDKYWNYDFFPFLLYYLSIHNDIIILSIGPRQINRRVKSFWKALLCTDYKDSDSQ
jgi:hypothetical protein